MEVTCSYKTLVNLYQNIRWHGVHGGAVSWSAALQVERLRVLFPMVSLEYFIDIILPAALWP